MKDITVLEEFLSIPCVIGHEKHFLNHLKRILRPLPYQVIDAKNALIVRSDASSRRLFAIHVDRMGLIAGKKYWQYAQFKQGKAPSQKLIAKVEERLKKDTFVTYDEDEYVGKAQVLATLQKKKKLYLTLSTPAKEGMVGAFPPNIESKKKTITAQLDNAISCAIAYNVLKKGFSGHLIFTTGEEIGESVKIINKYARHHRIERVIVLDTASVTSLEECDKVIITREDDAAKYNVEMVKSFVQLCKHHDIPYRVRKKGAKFRFTEVGRLLERHKHFRAAAIQLPIINNHTTQETTTKDAIKHYSKVLHLLLRNAY